MNDDRTRIRRRRSPGCTRRWSSAPAALADAMGSGRSGVAARRGRCAAGAAARPGGNADAGSLRPRIRREGATRIALRYRDPAGEASLAALVACMAAPGAPIAADPESLAVLALAERLAASDIPVLINGPTGTGKEVLSRFIHARSPRATGPFVAVNCAAMPEAMLEALLFGHQKGAFTGATDASEGFFRAADGGTLLLDEIAEMPLGAPGQAAARAAGGRSRADRRDPADQGRRARSSPAPTATCRPKSPKAGSAPTCIYRLNVFPLLLRPLRERRDDIAAARLRAGAAPRRRPSGRRPVDLATRRWRCSAARLAGQRPRAGKRRSAARCCWPRAQPTIGAEHIVFDRPARLVASDAAGEPEPTADDRAAASCRNIVQLSEARRDHGSARRLRRQPRRRGAPARHLRTHAALSPRLVPRGRHRRRAGAGGSR